MSEISQLEPQSIWSIFEEITKIPRPSKGEERIAAWLVDFAKEHSLEWKRDSIGNVAIYKPASQGYEDRATVVLQAHMDMVCEKNSDVDFDFNTDSIKTYIKDGWVTADGTTLGADCGIGMAAALAVLIDPTLEHGRVEVLFTVDEESGLTGAFELESDMISGQLLINLDSEDEGELFIGCAGGIDSVATFKYKAESAPAAYTFFRIDVNGLRGGHSGDDINKGLANANKVICRLLLQGQQLYNLRLSYVDGGNIRNAIPREAYAIFGIPSKYIDEFMHSYNILLDEISEEYSTREPDMHITINEMPEIDTVMDVETQRRFIVAIIGASNGVITMSQSVEGLVDTSTNLASIKFVNNDSIIITTSQRSPSESSKLYAMQMIESIFWLAGGDVTHSDGYPGWIPNLNSKILAKTKECYTELFGYEPKVKAVHAGLECGLFLEQFPGLDMISFGPTIRGVHSPDERLNIESVGKFWVLLTQLLRRL
ncbi:MAG: aminoacyl-histidine dipeptidase [Rikenellaceae bacterium]